MPLNLLGHFACGAGIQLTADCCGASLNTRTNSFQLTLYVPRFSDPWQKGLLEPPEMVAELTNPGVANEAEEQLRWGLVVDWSDGGPGQKVPTEIRVSRLGFKIFEAVTNPAELNAVRVQALAELDSWWTLFCSWVAVLTEQDPRDYLRAVEATRREPIWTWVDGEEVRRGQQASEDRPRRFDPEPLDVPTLVACTVLAGKGGPPPDEWMFIRDARSALVAGDYRRAVIDAGTAAELAITELLDQHLALVDTKLSDALMSRGRALEGRAKLMKELGAGVEPAGFTASLKTPRNDAAHKGHSPTKSVAQRAINIAAELVEQATPLLSLVPDP